MERGKSEFVKYVNFSSGLILMVFAIEAKSFAEFVTLCIAMALNLDAINERDNIPACILANFIAASLKNAMELDRTGNIDIAITTLAIANAAVNFYKW